MFCGHTHIQMLRRLEHALVVNPGAIGLPFSEWAPHTIAIAPWAEYGILSHDQGRLHVDLRRTTYDVAALLEAESRERHAARGVVGRLLAGRPPQRRLSASACRSGRSAALRRTTTLGSARGRSRANAAAV